MAGISVHRFYSQWLFQKDEHRKLQPGSVEGADMNYDLNLYPGSITGTLEFRPEINTKLVDIYNQIKIFTNRHIRAISEYPLEAKDYRLLVLGYIHTIASYRNVSLDDYDKYNRLLTMMISNERIESGERYYDPDLTTFIYRHVKLKLGGFPCEVARHIINDLSFTGYAFNEHRSGKSPFYLALKGSSSYFYFLKCKESKSQLFPITWGGQDNKFYLISSAYSTAKAIKAKEIGLYRKGYLQILHKSRHVGEYRKILREHLINEVLSAEPQVSRLSLLFGLLKTIQLSLWCFIVGCSLIAINAFSRVKILIGVKKENKESICLRILSESRILIFQHLKGEKTEIQTVIGVSLIILGLSLFITDSENEILAWISSSRF